MLDNDEATIIWLSMIFGERTIGHQLIIVEAMYGQLFKEMTTNGSFL